MNSKKAVSRVHRFIPPSWQLPLLLAIFVLVMRLISASNSETEWRYANGMYPHISRVLRWCTGWLPISFGDIIYSLFGIYILYKTAMFIKKLFRKQVTRTYLLLGFRKMLVFFLSVYLLFNALWGLNYRRQGIAWQLELDVQRYSTADLDTVLGIVSQRLHALADSQNGRQALYQRPFLFAEGANLYRKNTAPYPFMVLEYPSVKRSIFGRIGNYLGFQGYYNPFSGEAQVNTTVPVFMQPNIVCHEMAHQAGYAKENEANFVGYLAGKRSANPCFRYSAYFDLVLYGLLDMQLRDSARARTIAQALPKQVKTDIREWEQFRKKHKNPLEQVVMWFYGQYLKANDMPSGIATYNEVIAWLIAYYKKMGAEAV
ncbi:MAG: DUF3810 domain-containing protein [Dinghuibacter sp.]|nr:DUF3810 domain-containing protein [Dinghuibacter sp.]